MEELIKYFESLEARIAEYEKRIAALEEAQQTNEAVIASMEAEIEELKSRPAPEPQVVEKVEPEPVKEEPVVEAPAPVAEEEAASPKAAVYGKPVDDIRQAISLGDRFLYQRELFGQNAELMQRTLTEINELKSFDEAMTYIGSRFQWDTESNSYQQFIVSLHRRFG
jgi:prefoldin subunit 5